MDKLKRINGIAKTAAGLMAAALVVGSLGGCGGESKVEGRYSDDGGGSGGNGGDGGNGGGASGVRQRTVLKLGLWPEDTDTRNVMLFQKYKQTIEEKYSWITIEPSHYVYSVESFIPMAESGTAPNLFDTWFTEPQKLIANGYVADVTEKLIELGWYDDMNPSIRELMSFDKRVYGVPRDGYALGLFINLNLFRASGFVTDDGYPVYPKTLDELAEMAGTIKKKTGRAGFVILTMGANGGWQFSNIAWNFGTDLEDYENGKWVCKLNTPEAIAAMQWVSDLRWKYDALPEDVLQDWGQGFQAIGTNTAATYMAGQDAVDRPTKDYGLEVEDFAIAPLPAGPGGQYALLGGVLYMFSARSTSDQIDAGLKFLEIMGRAPKISEETLDGLKADAQYREFIGIPILPPIHPWTNKEYAAAFDEVRRTHENIDFNLYKDFYDVVNDKTKLHAEEPYLAQELYTIISPIMQEVLLNKDADIPALMQRANAEFQAKLDAEVNN